MNIWKIIYLNCGERYKFMIDHRSYTGFNFTTVVCVTAMINHKFVWTFCCVVIDFKVLNYTLYRLIILVLT